MVIPAERVETTANILAQIITICAITLALDGPYYLGLAIYIQQFAAVMLGLSLAICFLTVRVQPSEAGPPSVIDLVLALISAVGGVYLAWRYPVLSLEYLTRPVEALTIGVLLIPLLLEALRRTSGYALMSVVLLFTLYAVFADQVPGTLQGRAASLQDLLPFLAIDSIAIFGAPLLIVVQIIVAYIFFGQLLLLTGGSEWFTDIATSIVGRSRGGAAKIAVLASALFGSISGSAVANVASTGIITIPLMKRGGYSSRLAAGFEAVASTGGQIMPPVMGAAAFLMAEFLQVPYATIVLAAVVPAALFFLAILIQADLEAARGGMEAVPGDLVRPIGQVFREGWHFPIPFIVLVYALFFLNMTPAKAAMLASAAVIVFAAIFGYRGRRPKPIAIWRSLASTGRGSMEIILVGAAAGAVIGVLESSGLGFGLTFLLVEFGRGSMLLLLMLTAVICIVLGMGMPTTGIYLLVATLAAPPLIELGVHPIAAHLFILYFGLMSMISPPVALAAFAAASIAGASPMRTAVTSVRIGWPAFIIPFLFVYSPSLLLDGDLIHVVAAVLTAVAGVWLVSAGFVGYLRGVLTVPTRVVLALAGIMLLIPADAFAHAIVLELIGAAIAIVVVGARFLASERDAKLPDELAGS